MVQDHLGNTFNTIKDMAEHYQVNYSTLRRRLRTLPIETALAKTTKVYDHLGNCFSSLKEMYEHYGIPQNTARQRKERGWTLEQILTTPKRDYTVVDHTGKTFPTQQEMLDYYHISATCYKLRKKKGWGLKKILTTPSSTAPKTKPIDHLGNKFSSKKEMCEYHNIPYDRFRNRMDLGWDIKKALTAPITPSQNNKNKIFTDHLGNQFSSLHELCKQYNINKGIYQSRKKNGWSLEKILTTPNKNHNPVTDHKGITYKNKQQMCIAYDLSAATVNSRLRNGWSLQEALETPVERFQDHLGNTFPSVKKMCEQHNINPQAYLNRTKKYGWSIKKALTTPVYDPSVTDHLGNIYPNLNSMCKHYGINVSTYKNRKRKGVSTKNALTMSTNSITTSITDPFGQTFSSIKKLYEYYHIDPKHGRARKASNWSMIEQLELIPRINCNMRYNIQIFDNLTILRNIKDNKSPTNYYKICLNGENTIMTYNAIIELCTNILRKEHENGKQSHQNSTR